MSKPTKIVITPTFSINKIKSLQSRNLQLSEEIYGIIREKDKLDDLIKNMKNEIKDNIVRIEKLQKKVF